MTVTPEKIVEYLVKTKIRRLDYINLTDEDPNDKIFSVGADVFMMALTNCSGDFHEAAREYNTDLSTLWNNFTDALFEMSESNLLTYAATRTYFINAFENDYDSTTYPEFSKLRDSYFICYQAVIECWLYGLYSRVESEKRAEDKKENCKKLLYDLVGKAAISPIASQDLDNSANAGNNVSYGVSVQTGDQSSAILTGFFDFYDDLAD